MVAPSASTMVRVWPTLPQTPSWSRTALIGGIAAYRWRKRSGSGVGNVTSNARSTGAGTVRDWTRTTGEVMAVTLDRRPGRGLGSGAAVAVVLVLRAGLAGPLGLLGLARQLGVGLGVAGGPHAGGVEVDGAHRAAGGRRLGDVRREGDRDRVPQGRVDDRGGHGGGVGPPVVAVDGLGLCGVVVGLGRHVAGARGAG